MFTSIAQVPAVVPHLQPFLDVKIPNQIPKTQVDANAFPKKMISSTGIGGMFRTLCMNYSSVRWNGEKSTSSAVEIAVILIRV